MRWQFRPSLSATLAALLAVPLLASLGLWQLDRAAQKEALQRAFMDRSTGEPVDINRAGTPRIDAEYMQFRRARVRGQFLPGATILLDNQVHAGDPGYDAYTPFRLQDEEAVVLVNRGWVAAGTDRRVAPAIETPTDIIELTGLAKPPAVPPLMLGDTPPERLVPGILRVQRIDLPTIAAMNHWALLPYELRLEPGSTAGFTRDWPVPGSGRERHLGYAFQWFAMAVTVIVLYVYLNLGRKAET